MEKLEWEKFKTETKKLVSTFLASSNYSNTAKHEILDILDGMSESHHEIITILSIINSSKNQKEIAVAGMLAFLWEFEGNYVSCVDAFCYLLVANRHDLFDIIRRKFVHSIEDIGNVDISTKLDFLEEHDFGILRRTEDKRLRNKIAHHDFQLDNSGRLQIDNRLVDIESRLDDIHFFAHRVFEIFMNCFKD